MGDMSGEPDYFDKDMLERYFDDEKYGSGMNGYSTVEVTEDGAGLKCID